MISDDDVALAKLYFEEMFGCVVGCGCWEPGWDDADSVRQFAGKGFAWSEGPSPAAVLAALDRLARIEVAELPAACSALELHFADVAAFCAFWAPSREALREALARPSEDEPRGPS